MGCERVAVLADHLVGIAVVGGDKNCTAHAQSRIANSADALVNSLDSLNCGVENSCVTDHIAVSKVENNNIVLIGLDLLADCVANLVCAHLRLEVKGCNIGGIDKDSVLALKCLFLAAVKEECNVSVFLSFGNSELSLALRSKVFAHCHFKLLGRERNRYVRHGLIILSHTYICQREEAFLSLEAVKFLVNKGSCDLPCTVGAEIEEYNAVVLLDKAVLVDDSRNDELVSYAVCVGFLHALNGAVSLNALAVDHSSISLLNSVPCEVTVHSVVASHNRCDIADTELLCLVVNVLDKAHARSYGNVTAVHNAVNVNLVKSLSLCHFKKSEKMLNMAVNAAVGEKTDKVESRTVLLAVFAGVKERLILEEIAVLNGLGDFDEHLINNTSCADVCMTYLAVTHLTVGETDVKSGSADRSERVFLKNP